MALPRAAAEPQTGPTRPGSAASSRWERFKQRFSLPGALRHASWETAPAVRVDAQRLPVIRPVSGLSGGPVIHAVAQPAPDDGFQPPRVGDPVEDSPLTPEPYEEIPSTEPPQPPGDTGFTREQPRPIIEIAPFPDYDPDPQAEEVDQYPEEQPFGYGFYTGRHLPDSVFHWEASNVWYNPLYFQDVPLERYGHTHHPLIQPFVSVGQFGVQLVGLPYQMKLHPICKKIYPLGYYRPGECAPKLYYQIPLNADAAFTQAWVTTALFFIFP
ncbi:MAG: hypothetical protein ACREJB_05890 [Planctomycetaceae bacterium]